MTSGPDAPARMRGVFVGAVSGSLSIAAHGLGGGTMVPSESALVLLVVVSAALGGLVSQFGARIPLVAVLALGQVVGHMVLSIASEHHHALALTPSMLTAHVAATALCALIVRGAVLGCAHSVSVLGRILPVLAVVLPVQDRPSLPSVDYRPDVVLRLLVSWGPGTRGPPVAA